MATGPMSVRTLRSAPGRRPGRGWGAVIAGAALALTSLASTGTAQAMEHQPAVTVTWNAECTGFTAAPQGFSPTDTVTVRWHESDGHITGADTVHGNDVVQQREIIPGQAAIVTYEGRSDRGAPVTEFVQVKATCPSPQVKIQWRKDCTGVSVTMENWPQGFRNKVAWFTKNGREVGRTVTGPKWGKYNVPRKFLHRVQFQVVTPDGDVATSPRLAFAHCDADEYNPWFPFQPE